MSAPTSLEQDARRQGGHEVDGEELHFQTLATISCLFSPSSSPSPSAAEAPYEVERALGTPLDLLLADAASSPVRRFLPGMSGVRFTAGLARHPGRVAGRTGGLAAELAQGRRRPLRARAAREGPPLHRGGLVARTRCCKRTLQAYLAVGEAARGLVEDAELDWGDDQRMGFIVDNLVEASAPSNNPFLNPKVLKRIIDTGGGNLVEGGRRFVRDFATAPRVPSMVEPDAFEVGTDIAVTPGRGGAAHRRCSS